MNQAIKTIPVLRQIFEGSVDLFVAGDVAIENQFAVKFCCEFCNSVFKAIADISKCEFSAFAFACLCDAVSDRAIRQ
jgi:hypothetical protein